MENTTPPQSRTRAAAAEREAHDVAETRSVPLIDQPTLPFSASVDEPIPFRLTARARRTVAPDELPPLRVVASPASTARPGARDAAVDDAEVEDPTDTRGARARALRRAGMPLARIAEQLQVDPLLVRAWVGDLIVPPAVLRQALQHRDAGVAAHEHDDEVAFELARASARHDVHARLARDDGFAAGLGVAAALAEIDAHAVTFVTSDAAVLGMFVRWLQRHLPVEPARMRLVLRLDPEAAGDLERHRWSQATGLSGPDITTTRRRVAADRRPVEGLLRLSDPALAATLAGWCDALLESDGPDRVDAAF